MRKYTVILLYPDYIADQFGEVFTGHIMADDADSVIPLAAKECLELNDLLDTYPDAIPDFVTIAVYAGHLEPESWG